ncbi:MAG: hypothetical protein CBC48_02395 [bacterium TMED88]|nr:MAG: hypothetical protein CBC48_02395 [bacterium TMED88]
MAFDPKVVLQGNQGKRELEEYPTVGFTASGASSPEPTQQLGNNPTRKAGPGGLFAFRMMQDPKFADQIAGWRNLYNQSPPGVEFNAPMMDQQQQTMDVLSKETDMVAQEKEVEQM